jgi:hypothetical protein
MDLLDFLDIGNGMGGRQDSGVHDEPIFKLFDFTDHVSLILGRAIVMKDPYATQKLAGKGKKHQIHASCPPF